jgi:hypothetical protein
MFWLFRLFAVATLVCLMTTTVHAESDEQKASKHVVAGDKLKVRAERASDGGRKKVATRLFAAAAFEYQSAYDLVPHPLMLYNLAQVARLRGKASKALDLYKRYLKEETRGDAADFARSYVRFLEAKTKPKEKPPEQDKLEEEPVPEENEEDVELSQAKPTSSDSGKTLRYAGLGVAGAGILSIVVGTKFGLDARSISTTLSNHDTPWTDNEVRLDKEGEDAGKKMLLFTGIGAAALVGGGLLYYFGRSKSEESGAQATLLFAPQVDNESVSLGLVGSF